MREGADWGGVGGGNRRKGWGWEVGRRGERQARNRMSVCHGDATSTTVRAVVTETWREKEEGSERTGGATKSPSSSRRERRKE